MASKAMQFEVQKRLARDDFGDEIEEGFFMADLGRIDPVDTGPPVEVEPLPGRTPLSRAKREAIPERMAAQLMDYYMQPDVLNDATILNPLRDGIPQCTKHPFVSGDSKRIGCIDGCGPNERDAAGNLPVARDGTLEDVWQWVRALIIKAVLTQDKRLGYTKAADLGG
jgi:hypothetical protein